MSRSSEPTATRLSRGTTIRGLENVQPRSPFDLTTVLPDRRFPKKGDILYYPRTQTHGWLRREIDFGYKLLWINGLKAGETTDIDHSTLDYQAEKHEFTIAASDIVNLKDAWWLVNESAFDFNFANDETIQAKSPDDTLSLHRDRDRVGVNAFLEHPIVDHDLGSVPGWKACFTATYDGRRVAVAVLSRPAASALDDSSIITLSRYAAHPKRPENTATWLLSRARQWAALEGYDELRTYAGVSNNNEGTIYQASGFELDQITEADGEGWQNREGRDTWNDYTRRRYTYSLDRVTKPDPSDIGNRQPSLDAFTGGSAESEMHQARLEHLDSHQLNKRYNELYPTPNSNADISDSDAIFGFIKGSKIVGMIPLTINNQTAQIHSIAFDTETERYPHNTATRLVSHIKEWAWFEGVNKTTIEPVTDLEKRVAKQSNTN